MFVCFISGRLSETRTSTICDVMGLAKELGSDELRAVCENRLKHSVDLENVCSILKYAYKYQVRHVRNT